MRKSGDKGEERTSDLLFFLEQPGMFWLGVLEVTKIKWNIREREMRTH